MMKQSMKFGLCVVLGLGTAMGALMATDLIAANNAYAQRGAPIVIAAAPLDPPNVKNSEGIAILPSGLRWGMTSAQLADVIDREIDRSYKSRFEKAQSGPQTTRLEAQLATEKSAFRRSKLAFGELPTGIDSTPLKGEYTYRNNESMMKWARTSGDRYFFFIQDKLWKIYDEVPLGERKPLGATFEDAATTLSTRYGVAGRLTDPDYMAGRLFTEIDWEDPRTHLRLLDRSGLGIAA
ncbi:MAG: hypothetical protein FWD57_03450, partial [Polyangiaceae bacterium]|nr:hypothetical protein [Polyangiaceae bacterium]